LNRWIFPGFSLRQRFDYDNVTRIGMIADALRNDFSALRENLKEPAF
jgi:hypothetical protein